MLSVTTYPQEYVDACRARVQAQVAAYRQLLAAARDGGSATPPLTAAIDEFEPVFFGNMVLVLDTYFTHRARMHEGKDGNPLNEVRVLCSSLLTNGGVLKADKTIKLKAASSILGLEIGDEVRLSEDDFARLAEAYFAELERRYV
jgi:hypothetical protein